ncbi:MULTISPECIES: hypothetical protein [unclassified Bacillus (in: firmicutes)]|uniref:hypothetical protein n=1 Tax=unclassified Bacillus (in: firmicutes) TaxID=185979 RepID=UPI0008EFEE78|nr:MULTISPECIES: hypothetical protein [unclassified Bacillus (in: firmicutes)]SFI12300.1 hypothetical protein SAMN04488574_101680 [Bacillus sp. 71mf]SFS75320.1 hypothetical protein SAMN04488145_10397 [Bacillus sp. 103mf]
MIATKPKRGEFYIYREDGRVYQILGYAKMFEQDEQDIIILKRMKDRVTITLSSDLFILYITADKFIKDKVHSMV